MEFLTLNNGVEMPSLGLGVFQSSPEDTADAVAEALRVGYRHIDTAAAYGNEKQVGEGIRQSGVDRSEVFIETKLWISDYGYDQALHSFDKSAGKLGVDEFQGGTFTVSNLGMLGVSGFDAIINPPQVAILAVGAGVRRVVVADDGSFQARTVMEICLSGDHRVIDGATGATFVGEVKAILESPAQMLV